MRENATIGKRYSERIETLKERMMSAPYQVDYERLKYFTRAYKDSGGVPPAMRAAKGLQEALNNMTIWIDDTEWLVGSKTAKKFAPVTYIEWGETNENVSLVASLFKVKKAKSLKEMFPNGLGDKSSAFLEEMPNVSDEEYRELVEEFIPFWRDKTIDVIMRSRWEEEGIAPKEIKFDTSTVPANVKMMMTGGAGFGDVVGVSPMQGHVTIGLKNVLDKGFKGIARQAAQKIETLEITAEDYEQRKDFLEAVQVSAVAVCAFAGRYAELAEKTAEKTEGQRKQELLEIAERCRHVPAEPPRNFMEALQSIWMTQVALAVACGDAAIVAPGRVDQFLFPYYQQDLQTGRISREIALEAIQEYWIKLASFIFFGPNNITIGGINRNNEDAVNEVSYLFLEAHKALKGLRNGLAVRLNQKTPRDFLFKACDVHRDTAGVAFYNDEVVIRDLMEDGYSLEDARDYSIVGCVEPTGTGDNNGYTSGNAISLISCLEMCLNEGGRWIVDWNRVGAATPPASTFKTFEDVKKAFADQVAYCIELAARRIYLKDQVIAENYPLPLLSSTITGCLESGKDITSGGARYNHGSISASALATISDSLTAIRWAVFEKKLLTMEELVNHLRNNFEGAEDIRQQLRNAPKYGNDDKSADELAMWVLDVYNQETYKHKSFHGGPQRACMISVMGSQVTRGLTCGATPDGRLAQVPLSTGLSPSNGNERNGMTAVLRSAATVSAIRFSDGTSLNLNFNPEMIKTDEGLEKFAALIEAYMDLGGRHVQFNPVSRGMLLDAQAHPENYPELMVKVSGYSFRFIDLSKGIQDDIISRTEFTAI